MKRETIDWPRFENIYCLAASQCETRWWNVKRGRRVAKLCPNNGATDIWARSKASLSKGWFHRTICDCLSSAPFRPKYGRGDDLEKSINPARGFCMGVRQRGGGWQWLRWKNGARFPNISSLITAARWSELQAKNKHEPNWFFPVQTGLRRDFYQLSIPRTLRYPPRSEWPRWRLSTFITASPLRSYNNEGGQLSKWIIPPRTVCLTFVHLFRCSALRCSRLPQQWRWTTVKAHTRLPN